MTCVSTLTTVEKNSPPQNAERQSPRLPRKAVILTTIVCTGLLIRLTIQDRIPILSMAYYMLQFPVLIVLAGAAAIMWYRKAFVPAALANVVLAVVCFALYFNVSYFQNGNSNVSGETFRVAFWNPGRLAQFQQKVFANEVRRFDADVVALVESGIHHEVKRLKCQNELPDYEIAYFGHGIGALVRGHILSHEFVPLDERGWCCLVEFEVDGRQATLAIVDIESNPAMDRTGPLGAVVEIMNNYRDRPIILAGDFNTPAESVHFRQLRSEHTSAFESTGTGFAATWPVPLPVLSLDQIWGNRLIGFAHCYLDWSLQSDHRPVVADLTILTN